MNDQLLSDVGIKLRQYIATCSLGGLPCNITRDFKLMFHPYYFNCYTYRRPTAQHCTPKVTRGEQCDGSSENDLPWLTPGLDNGLSVVVLTGSGMVDRIKGEVGFVPPGLYDAGGALSLIHI